jgi:hypothetical protein
MNAKVKVIAAVAVVQLIVLALFAQHRNRGFSHDPVYQITGRVMQVNADRIVIRAQLPDRGTFVVFQTIETQFWGAVRVGDTVAIDYKMVAVKVTPVGPPRSR